MAGKIWLVTGSSSGFGRLMTETALKHGDKVVATLRKPEALSELSSEYPSSQLLVLKLDVTKRDEVKKAFSAAHAHFGRIDVVFNNAGNIVFGPIEGTPDHLSRELFELNLWGAVNVSSTAVEGFREYNKPAGGHLIQMSSHAGITGFPRVGFYSGTKFALEGVTEALAAELDPTWNIKVTLLEPGSFYTGGHGRGDFAPPHPAYKQPDVSKMLNGEGMSDPVKGVEAVYRMASLHNPPLHFPLGKDALATISAKAKKLLAATEEYAGWSEGLELESKL
ncbi:NAD(P)-binding protein [Daedalea quercina L-15889]|uniref:NAD(P)-binding protein n=1 Tax=Daedalea quercina L-15889 TaxID=1314783 RepID=A0A165NNY5_9APHY|nr:NAD(P)-binding protein [Daedalea quercina L-15889]